jgi:hypothetical protein
MINSFGFIRMFPYYGKPQETVSEAMKYNIYHEFILASNLKASLLVEKLQAGMEVVIDLRGRKRGGLPTLFYAVNTEVLIPEIGDYTTAITYSNNENVITIPNDDIAYSELNFSRVSDVIVTRDKNPIAEFTYLIIDNATGNKISINDISEQTYFDNIIYSDTEQSMTNKNFVNMFIDGKQLLAIDEDFSQVKSLNSKLNINQIPYLVNTTGNIQGHLDSLVSSMYNKLFIAQYNFSSADAVSETITINKASILSSLSLNPSLKISAYPTLYLYVRDAENKQNEWRLCSQSETQVNTYDVNVRVILDADDDDIMKEINIKGDKLVSNSGHEFMLVIMFNIGE